MNILLLFFLSLEFAYSEQLCVGFFSIASSTYCNCIHASYENSLENVHNSVSSIDNEFSENSWAKAACTIRLYGMAIDVTRYKYLHIVECWGNFFR